MENMKYLEIISDSFKGNDSKLIKLLESESPIPEAIRFVLIFFVAGKPLRIQGAPERPIVEVATEHLKILELFVGLRVQGLTKKDAYQKISKTLENKKTFSSPSKIRKIVKFYKEETDAIILQTKGK